MQAGKELDDEWKSANVNVNKHALGRRQTETLNHIFATYFRVLKHGRSSPMLPAVLKGLSKHAHLIDASFFGDLMKVLQAIMEDEDLGPATTLNCVLTGCKLLSGQAGMSLNIDVKTFHDALYVFSSLLFCHVAPSIT
jgi:nucleolar complex protein 3